MGYSIFDETMVDMNWLEIEEAIKQKAIVLLPVGVIEEHGPHMGLAVDTYVSYLISKLVRHELEKRSIKTLIAPPQYWGINNLTACFPGSFSVRPETMKAVLFDTLASLKSWGINDVFCINWHAEYQHVMTILDAVQEAHTALGIKVYSVMADNEIKKFKLTGKENYIVVYHALPMPGSNSLYLDLHAGSLETGVMLSYFPEQVNKELTESLEPTRITSNDFKTAMQGKSEVRKIIPSGYFGNPAHFDQETSRIYIEDKATSLAELIESVINGQYKPQDTE
jgi:creatinine amidohydrolase